MPLSRLFVFVALVSISSAARAQPSSPVACCRITSIDAQSGLVAAKQMDTGAPFNFKFDSGPVPATLKIDQLVWARGGKVSLNGTQNCCTIVTSRTAPGFALREKNSSSPRTSYAAESTAHAQECDQVAHSSFPSGGHTCVPKGAVISSGKNRDGSDATYSWTCACS